MRTLVGLALCALALASTTSAVSAASSVTSIRVTYWPDGSNASRSAVWTLRCRPASGSLKQPERACRRLAADGVKLFAPSPKGVACTQIYGGPQRARVVGTVDGTHVWATLARSDGCAIARWQRISPWLVPAGGVP